jgi:hypothetical protein
VSAFARFDDGSGGGIALFAGGTFTSAIDSGDSFLARWGCAAPASCPADVDGDGLVGVQDLTEVILAWGAPGGSSDVNDDGVVDVLDLTAIILAWGKCS